jgi:hypothetical protein
MATKWWWIGAPPHPPGPGLPCLGGDEKGGAHGEEKRRNKGKRPHMSDYRDGVTGEMSGQLQTLKNVFDASTKPKFDAWILGKLFGVALRAGARDQSPDMSCRRSCN